MEKEGRQEPTTILLTGGRDHSNLVIVATVQRWEIESRSAF